MLIWILSMVAASAFAILRGGWPERLVGAGLVIGWVASVAVLNRQHWLDPQWGILGCDLVYLGLLVILALTTDRIWLLFASAFQLLCVVIHVGIMVDPGARTLAYLRGLTIWSYLIVASIVIGTWAYDRRASQGRPGQAGVIAPTRR
jgi:hypothetical protein